MTNPVSDFFEEFGHEKRAFSANHFGGSMGRALEQGVGGAIAAGAIAGAGIGVQKLWQAATKGRDFKQMMEHNPDLQEYHDRDPRSFNAQFSSLRRVNPDFGSDPVIAGTYMRRMSENPFGAGGILTEGLMAADKAPRPLGDALRGAAQGAGNAFIAEHSKQTLDQKADEEDRLGKIRQAIRNGMQPPRPVDPNLASRQSLEAKKLQRDHAAIDREQRAGRERSHLEQGIRQNKNQQSFDF